jgi:hypothetical protein
MEADLRATMAAHFTEAKVVKTLHSSLVLVDKSPFAAQRTIA